MSALRPDTVVNIGKRRCVILRDAVAHTLPPSNDVVVLDRCDGKMIYCALSVLESARKRYPGLPAYGFWQVLFHSGRVSSAARLQSAYFDGDDGQYLYQEDPGLVFVGEIRGGELIETAGYKLPDRASTTSVSAINCDIRDLHLPRSMALSFAEREHARVANKFKLTTAFISAVVFVCAALLTYESRQRLYLADQQLVHGALAARVDALTAQKIALQQTRIEAWPDQRRSLNTLLQVAIALPRFTLPETPLAESMFEAQTARSETLPTWVTTVVDSFRHRRDGLLSLQWSNQQ